MTPEDLERLTLALSERVSRLELEVEALKARKPTLADYAEDFTRRAREREAALRRRSG